jgi:hypothetical protein
MQEIEGDNFKLDFEKVYVRVNWEFLKEVMVKK